MFWRKRKTDDGAAERLRKSAVLIGITRNGRQITFTFRRNNEIIRINAMGTWSDDIQGWTNALLDDIE